MKTNERLNLLFCPTHFLNWFFNYKYFYPIMSSGFNNTLTTLEFYAKRDFLQRFIEKHLIKPNTSTVDDIHLFSDMH